MQINKTLKLRTHLLSGATFTAMVLAAPAMAQDAMEEVVVTGTRQVIQSTINIKRNATQIVDGLSANEIGDLPALSIGEAIESIAGAASHRENGGATEISIRGLGPFLSSTTFNGREATNGSGDRSVNFSQFPSELLNKIAIYKTQDASLVEGGVAGLISLETIKPLDYGKQRIQAEIKGNVNPDQLNQSDTEVGDIGYRGTLSYVDQFEIKGLGDIGISVGLQRSDISQPEAEMRSSSTPNVYACIFDENNLDRGFGNIDSGTDCEDSQDNDTENGIAIRDNQGYHTQIGDNGLAVDDGQTYGFVSSARSFRQNDTRDERDSIFGAVQWQPNDRLDVNLDGQWSKRTQSEDRYDIIIGNGKDKDEADASVGFVGTIAALQIGPDGTINNWENVGVDVESNGEIYSREEEYIGGGLSASYDITDRLTGSVDLSFSETTRLEQQISLRSRASKDAEAVRWSRNDDGIVTFDLVGFDVTDGSLFTGDNRARIDSDADRTNRSEAIRFDFDYDLDYGAIQGVEFGARASQLTYLALEADRTTVELDSGTETTAIASDCANDKFLESNFFGGSGVSDLFSNVSSLAADATVSSTSNTWATIDNQCRLNAILAANNIDSLVYPELVEEADGTIDVTEETLALYAMANYDTEIGSIPVRGNVGVRVVNTSVDSIGYRQGYLVEETITGTETALNLVVDPDVPLERVSASHEYTEVLPSFTFVADVADDVVVRGGIFRGLSRVDPSDMSFGRAFTVSGDADITEVSDLISSVQATGNPAFDALTSWNYDLSAEIYPDADSIVSLGVYYKSFKGGFETVEQTETYSVDGVLIPVLVDLSQTNADESSLYGIEFTGSHSFSYLPSYFSGLGVKASYNYAASDFEFQDDRYGDGFITRADGTIEQTDIGIVAPGSIPGLSTHTFSGQAYYQIGGLDTSLIYKYRSQYFQPFTGDGGDDLRYIGDVGVWEARASYKINNNVRVSLEGINLFDAPKEQYTYTDQNLGEVNYYGPRVFFGLRAKF